MKKRLVLALGVLSGIVVLEDGCLIPVQREEVVVSGPVEEYGWEPIYYDGYVVYYTDDGIPFYYMGGTQVWIPAHERYHYTERYYQRREAYHTWYQRRGREYHGYRHQDRPTYHQERPVVRPRDDGRPIVHPQQIEEHRPVVRPRDDGEHKPVIRPHQDIEHKQVITPRHDVERKPVIRHKNDNDANKHKIGPH
jgi:hypothetical protein